MRVCESCIGAGYTERIYNTSRIKVVCPTCLGVGSLSLGQESHDRWRQLREIALAKAIREGWYEDTWDGEPGQARRVLRLVGPAEMVKAS